MKYMEIDFERDVIRVYRLLNISPTDYQPYRIYKLNRKRMETIEKSELHYIPVRYTDGNLYVVYL